MSPKTRCRRGHEFTPDNTDWNTAGHRVCRTCRAQKRCHNGHLFTPANTYVRPDGFRSCRECRSQSQVKWDRRHHHPHPSQSGWCRKGIHPWVESNIVTKKDGRSTCRMCGNDGRLRRYKEKRLIVIRCAAGRCNRATMRESDGTYICPRHRRFPPSWIASSRQRIVGTRLVRVA